MLRVRRLGTVPYEEGQVLSRALAQRARDDYLLILEHPAVYTLGVRAKPEHLLVAPEELRAEVVVSDRGGDVTYHGPGQLIVYPIVTVPGSPSAGRDHVRRLEQTVIDCLAGLQVQDCGRLDPYPGVWLEASSARPVKIAAVGVRTKRVPDGRRRTLHGIALNVDCDLTMFERIVPCGISELPVGSLASHGYHISMSQVSDALVAAAARRFGPVSDDCAVSAPRSANLLEGTRSERAPLRRLREAGVQVDASVELKARKPPWLRAPMHMGEGYRSVAKTVSSLSLHTVCEEAGCPNISECWSEGTATFMVNGSRCTRACGFCLVDTRHPLPLDPQEPHRVGLAVAAMDLEHAVVTCVARDDLPDGGAGAIAATVESIRAHRPGTAVEILISDCKGDPSALDLVFAQRPEVLNHNIETVARLQRAVRPSARYARSLGVLARAADAGLVVKSGLMVGLGETEGEVISTLSDLCSVGVRIVTIGQYLRPSAAHLPVARWWRPEEFERLAAIGRALGLAHVESSPLTRSSYHARGAARAANAEPAQSAS
ncbi:MAG: lipoyl synthase [Acidimicrobiales bacterium]